MSISVIIRTKNEERWIGKCLKQVMQQTVNEFEVILVDNNSTDKTVAVAKHCCPEIKLLELDDYRPGFSINSGIRASRGDYIVCLSAHCLPVQTDWLEMLLKNFDDKEIAGVYGRQIPMKFSPTADKRDLFVTFGLDRRIQKRDTFFHNANSMVRRDVWERYPFNEEVPNIEDRVWGKDVIEAGYCLIYEPEAAVYHYHGIHQNGDEDRCRNVVRIMEYLESDDSEMTNPLDPERLEIATIIPVRTSIPDSVDLYEPLILETIKVAKNSRYIDQIIISTDDDKMHQQAIQWGATQTILRPAELSSPEVRADAVIQYTLTRIEEQGYYPDLIIPLEITYPFRPLDLLDKLIIKLLEEGLDTVIAGFSDYRPCWINNEGHLTRVDDYSINRENREPVHIGLPSLGCITYPEFVRNGSRLGSEIGIYEITDPIQRIEIRSSDDLRLMKILHEAVLK